ncbi:MAG: LysE family translocator [Gammaproteobacteria bacterium]
MTDYAQLWLFFVIVLGVVLLPGLDMTYVLGSALSGGRSAGLTAVSGIVAGGICLVTLTTLGIGVLLRTVPAMFNVLLLAGALYIAWIGISIACSRSHLNADAQVNGRTRWLTFRQGMLTTMLNPKAYLFLLAIFPQFLHPQRGALWFQALVLWIIIALTQTGIYGSVALLGDKVRGLLHANPAAGMVINRVVGTILILAAVFTAYDSWRQL